MSSPCQTPKARRALRAKCPLPATPLVDLCCGQLADAFDKFDKNSDGAIELSELKKWFEEHKGNLQLNDKELELVLQNFDTNHVRTHLSAAARP